MADYVVDNTKTRVGPTVRLEIDGFVGGSGHGHDGLVQGGVNGTPYAIVSHVGHEGVAGSVVITVLELVHYDGFRIVLSG